MSGKMEAHTDSDVNMIWQQHVATTLDVGNWRQNFVLWLEAAARQNYPLYNVAMFHTMTDGGNVILHVL